MDSQQQEGQIHPNPNRNQKQRPNKQPFRYQQNRRQDSKNKVKQGSVKKSLLFYIEDALKNGMQDHQKMMEKKYSITLQLRVIEKKPLYVADQDICIQCLNRELPKQILNPFNKLANSYYAPHSKPHIVFNCHDAALENDQQENQPIKYPSAYHPAYHYLNYQQFKQKRKNMQILDSCQKIQVKIWSLAIVNISCKGYYAPLLIIHDMRKITNSRIEKLVQNVLFCKEITPYLENFRISDMRKMKYQKTKNIERLSFYMRNQISMKKKTNMTQFVSLDLKNTLVKNNQSLPLSFIPLGTVSEYEIFKRPVNPKYLSKKQVLNLDKFEPQQAQQRNMDNESDLSLEQRQQIQDARYRQTFLDENQQQEGQNFNRRGANEEYRIEEEYLMSEESQSSQEDYLKALYKKKMEQKNQHII